MTTKTTAKAIRDQLKARNLNVSILSVMSGFEYDPSYVNSMLRSGKLAPTVKDSLDKLCIKY